MAMGPEVGSDVKLQPLQSPVMTIRKKLITQKIQLSALSLLRVSFFFFSLGFFGCDLQQQLLLKENAVVLNQNSSVRRTMSAKVGYRGICVLALSMQPLPRFLCF